MAKTTKTTATSNVSLGLAIQTQDFDMVTKVVENAIAIVTEAQVKATGVTVEGTASQAVASVVAVIAAPQPKVPNIDTVHGSMPLTAIFDEETIWAQITSEYAELTQQIAKLPEEGKKLAVAKLIVENAVLRNCTAEAQASVDGLI